MKPDPRIPPDGSCAVCGKPRQPQRSRRYGRLEAERDPFCSSPCAREWHKNPLPGGQKTAPGIREDDEDVVPERKQR